MKLILKRHAEATGDICVVRRTESNRRGTHRTPKIHPELADEKAPPLARDRSFGTDLHGSMPGVEERLVMVELAVGAH